jgi:hypothetical protein
MNNVKNVFSIKDLENLSGIKAHLAIYLGERYMYCSPCVQIPISDCMFSQFAKLVKYHIIT